MTLKALVQTFIITYSCRRLCDVMTTLNNTAVYASYKIYYL